jgi:hypothetical protein
MPANYVLLQSVQLTDTTTSISFSNIPQSGYTDLKLVCSTRSTVANVTDDVYLTFNNVSTSIYSVRAIQGSGSATTSFTVTNTSLSNAISNGANSTANTFGSFEYYITNYLSSNNKSVSIDSVQENNSSTAFMRLLAGLVQITNPISSLTVTSTGNFVANSTFYLYGIAAVGTTPVIAPKATGGDTIYNDGTNWIHIFYSTGVFTPQTGLSCDYLVVAGGGGGASGGSPSGRGAGGGGAGGMLSGTSFALSNAVTVSVGSGGTGATAGFTNGTSGTNSGFSSITAIGGGFGGAQSQSGASGGSGGGSGNLGGAGGTATSGQGNNGGAGSSGEGSGSGGGGKGSSGQAGTEGGQGGNAAGGSGGSGSANSYSGTSVTYAAGGRGGNQNQTSSPGAAGAVNTGNGGGGGAGTQGAVNVGGNGGSGIVIIRYPIA